MKTKLLAVLLLLAGIASASTTTVNLSGTGRFKAFDPDTGALLAGGSLCSFIGGTSTPNTTYADSTGTIANSVCVTLDGSGEAAVWLDPAVTYKLVLKDASAAVIWTLDGVNTPAAGVFTTLTSNVATGTAPFTVSSTTKVANLNADQLDGGDWSAPPVGIGSTTAVPGTSQFTNLTILGNWTQSGGTVSFANASFTGAIGFSGTIQTYNGILLVGNGVPSEVALVDLTAQTAAVGTTTLYTCPTAGQYQLLWNAKVTTAAGTSSTLGGLTIVYTDPDGVAVTIGAAANLPNGTVATFNAVNTTASSLQGIPLLLNCKAGTNITYAMGYASNAANAMNYNLHIRLLAL